MKSKYLLSCLEIDRSLSLTHCDVTYDSCVIRNPSNFLYFHIDNFRNIHDGGKTVSVWSRYCFYLLYCLYYFTPKFIADEIDKIILILNAFTYVHSKPKILFWNQFATLDVTVWGMLPFLTNYTLDWNCHCTRYKIGTNKSRDVYTSLIKVRDNRNF